MMNVILPGPIKWQWDEYVETNFTPYEVTVVDYEEKTMAYRHPTDHYNSGLWTFEGMYDGLDHQWRK